MTDPSFAALENCLAYQVVREYRSWLGTPSPTCLVSFLIGVQARVALTRSEVSEWRISGPLDIPEFYMPLVARTGHPTLTIKWATALEIHHFSLESAMFELQTCIEKWVVSGKEMPQMTLLKEHGEPPPLMDLFRSIAKRPPMYLGCRSGWALRCFLTGMDKGGDWLSLPRLDGLLEAIDCIEEQSLQCYGSRFAAYRIYEDMPDKILEWVIKD